MKAIDTQYKGYNFRSRLEARWAVFFDALGLKWEYEPEGFELEDGTKYLPDFKVRYPDGGEQWFEVKSSLSNMSLTEWLKVLKFEKESGYGVIVLDGTPEPKMYQNASSAIECDDIYAQPHRPEKMDELINALQNNRSFKVDESFKRSGEALLCHKGRTWWDDYDNFWTDQSGWGQEELIYACKKARSARFEHGRSGS
jgi:hypothetical protein